MTPPTDDTDRHLSLRAAARRKARPAYAMRALGRHDLPEQFRLGDATWHHVQTVKHDFFAATGFYRADDGRKAVLKRTGKSPIPVGPREEAMR